MQDIDSLRREVRSLRAIILAMAMFMTVGLIGAAGSAASRNTLFDEITVRRINLVDNDGTLRLAISNKDRFPAPIMHGKPFGVGMRSVGNQPSFIFYNADGDEQGGFRWGGKRFSKTGFDQFMSLSADQFEQNDDLILSFEDSDGGRSAGLSGQEQPETTPLDILTAQLDAAVARGNSEADKKVIRQKFIEEHFSGKQRFFVGYRPEGSKLSLSDRQGNARLVLFVSSATGKPALAFLDAQGKITYKIAPEGMPAK